MQLFLSNVCTEVKAAFDDNGASRDGGNSSGALSRERHDSSAPATANTRIGFSGPTVPTTMGAGPRVIAQPTAAAAVDARYVAYNSHPQSMTPTEAPGRAPMAAVPSTQGPGDSERDPTSERMFDVAVLVAKHESRAYAELVERRLYDLSLNVDVCYLIDSDNMQKAVEVH